MIASTASRALGARARRARRACLVEARVGSFHPKRVADTSTVLIDLAMRVSYIFARLWAG